MFSVLGQLSADVRVVSATTVGNRPRLCLLQAEVATLNASTLPGLIVGSQDATTCLIAIIHCPLTSCVWAAHTDSSNLGSGDVAHLSSALALMQQPQLYMAGSYCDDRGTGQRVAQGFLQLLHSLPAAIDVQLCCIGSVNTAANGRPCTCQMVFDTASNTVHPWKFDDRGPEVSRRFAAEHCRQHHTHSLLNVWESQWQQLLLAAFDPTVISSWAVMRYEQMLSWSDERLLQVMSTSPEHEPEGFCQDMRNMLQFIIDAQQLTSEARKAASTTARYHWSTDGGSWVKAASQQHTHMGPVAAAVTTMR